MRKISVKFTLCAALLVNDLAYSLHMAGTVTVQHISSKLMMLQINAQLQCINTTPTITIPGHPVYTSLRVVTLFL